MAKKVFNFTDTSVSSEDAIRRLENLGMTTTRPTNNSLKPTKRPSGPSVTKTTIGAPQPFKTNISPPPSTTEEPSVAEFPPAIQRSSSKYRGVPTGYIRFSYIVREEYHETMRSIAKEHGASIREIMDRALEATIGKYVGKYEPVPQKEPDTPEKKEKLKILF
ncbi:MAG: hypothetical protein OEZ28_00145 [Nitrospinota bacterium]|nr:hypothetical protein [Nitrospinota bacterium]